jgi:hypothetical protein
MANVATATFAGRSLLWSRMQGTGTAPKYIKWGDSLVTSSANADVALFKPQTEAPATGTNTVVSTVQLADTWQVTGTLTCLVATKTISEMVLSDTPTLSGSTTIAGTTQSAAALSLTVGAGANLPTSGNFYVQTENEVQLVTGGQNTQTLTVTRSVFGTTATTHGIGVPVTFGGDGGATAFGIGGQTTSAALVGSFGGSQFCHADFIGIGLAVNDSILFTVKDTLT